MDCNLLILLNLYSEIGLGCMRLILNQTNIILIYTCLKTVFLNHSETLTKAIKTGTSTNRPMTIVKATGEANPKVAIATAKANSKIIACCRKRNGSSFWIIIPHPLTHKETNKEHHYKINS